MKRRIGLIDGDVDIYQAAAACEMALFNDESEDASFVVTPDAAKRKLTEGITEVVKKLKLDDVIVCLSDPGANWRKQILPTYKGNRSERKPYLIPELRKYVISTYTTKEGPGLEGDDVMGIIATGNRGGKYVICSIDKDMKTIPGWLYNYKDDKPVKITREEADYNHMYQTLVGDVTDGYKGCPGVGDKGATKLLEGWGSRAMWGLIASMYESKGLTEADALVQAQVARICRAEDYNEHNSEVSPWTP